MFFFTFLGIYKLGQGDGGWGGAHSSVYTVYTGPLHIITSAYIIVSIHYTSLPGPPAILYSAYRPFDMFLLSSRYDLKFHAFSSRYNVYTNSLHIIATAYIIVFIHYTNSPAYSATGYIIVCIQGKASP